jgi:putative Mg2+ transporter-C (MgtC) family protein
MTLDTPALAEQALRLGLALLLGSAIGFERQWAQKMAGLRTNALVALGAAGFVVFASITLPNEGARMAAQVVSGIGFLGAGIIMREGVNVHGLNTAATLWCSAMVGCLAASGHLWPSLLAALLVVATNLLLRPLAARMNRRAGAAAAETHYTVEIACRGADDAALRALLVGGLAEAGLGLRRLESRDIADTDKVRVTAQAVTNRRDDAALERIVGRLSADPNVTAATWQIDQSIPVG